MSLISEFSKRNVFRVGAAYLVGAWLLIQVAETLFPLFGYGDTPARIVVIVLAIGFLPALVLAWAFRLTPEGLRKESDVEVALSASATKRLDRGIMAVLALALCVFGVDRFVLTPQRDAKRQAELASQIEDARQQGRTESLLGSYGGKSIAVLPFVNMSDDAANEFFSDGISEELLNLLAKIPELRVISRSSSFSTKARTCSLGKLPVSSRSRISSKARSARAETGYESPHNSSTRARTHTCGPRRSTASLATFLRSRRKLRRPLASASS